MALALSPLAKRLRATCRWCSDSLGLRPRWTPRFASVAPALHVSAEYLKGRISAPHDTIEILEGSKQKKEALRVKRLSLDHLSAVVENSRDVRASDRANTISIRCQPPEIPGPSIIGIQAAPHSHRLA
jgi:hypothetical protein